MKNKMSFLLDADSTQDIIYRRINDEAKPQ